MSAEAEAPPVSEVGGGVELSDVSESDGGRVDGGRVELSDDDGSSSRSTDSSSEDDGLASSSGSCSSVGLPAASSFLPAPMGLPRAHGTQVLPGKEDSMAAPPAKSPGVRLLP